MDARRPRGHYLDPRHNSWRGGPDLSQRTYRVPPLLRWLLPPDRARLGLRRQLSAHWGSAADASGRPRFYTAGRRGVTVTDTLVLVLTALLALGVLGWTMWGIWHIARHTLPRQRALSHVLGSIAGTALLGVVLPAVLMGALDPFPI